MVGVRSHKKLTCLSGPAPTVEPGTISTVRPERHGKLVYEKQGSPTHSHGVNNPIYKILNF